MVETLAVLGCSSFWVLMGLLLFSSLCQTSLCSDLRDSIIAGNETCFNYDPAKGLFNQTCPTLEWKNSGYGPEDFITLAPYEVFDGGSGHVIDLQGVRHFAGLIRVNTSSVQSFEQAPFIHNVHMQNGLAAEAGGFIVQKFQKFFVIDSCSSTGIIMWKGGGICGEGCGEEGQIIISNSYTTGDIAGDSSGGITGEAVGYSSGLVNITDCYSTGSIGGWGAGGILGHSAAKASGQVFVTRSFSSGHITNQGGGGIAGTHAGNKGGQVTIEQCFSTGNIDELASGGICGIQAAREGGVVIINNCYSTGHIKAMSAGGILGGDAGSEGGEIFISRVYASGGVLHFGAGGIIGTVDDNAKRVEIKFTVFNSSDNSLSDMVNGALDINDTNTGYLSTIRGRLWNQWSPTIWYMPGWNMLPTLRFHRTLPSPTPTETRTPSASQTGSVSCTTRCSNSATATQTSSASYTRTTTSLTSPTITETPSATVTPIQTQLSSASASPLSTHVGATPTTSPTHSSFGTATSPSTAPVPDNSIDGRRQAAHVKRSTRICKGRGYRHIPISKCVEHQEDR
eukprot:gb/GECG01006912.1/.p1 GENE.gb/GECG01006912.1/~~gb/GECG01006912.1/.p1  ORF type:complete len:567 (+),score=46.11 gb/GECG01006912.1/:1-1701(+)